MQDGIHEVAGAVAGEGAAGAVGSVSARSEAEDEDAGVGIAEARNRLSPVLLVSVGFAAGLADAADIGDEAGAAGAIGNGLLERIKDGEGMSGDRPLGAHGGVFLGTG